jgi:sn-glycerol 3-phosphate transport system substrate-binding protein
MKKSLFVVLMILLCSAAMVFAAGSKQETQGPVTLELWSSLTGAKANTFDSQVAKFNGSRTDIAVKVVHQGGYDIVRQKMAAAANAKALPQIIIADYIDVDRWAQMGILYPIKDIVSKETIDDYYPSMLLDLTYKGTLYAIPYNRSTQGFYVNNDLIRQAGLSGPAKTWQQFESDARLLKQRLGADYYYGYAFFNQFLFDAISYTWNAAISTPDGKILLNSPEQVAMMEYFQRLYRENLLLMQPVLVGGFQEQHGAFLDGRVVSVFQTTSFLPTAASTLDSDWSFEYIPAGPGGNAITIGGGNLTVSATVNPRQLEAAKIFFEYMSSLDVVAQFFIETANMPVRRSALERGDIKQYIATNPSAKTMLDQLQFGRPAPSVTKNIGDVFNRVNDIITRIVYEGQNAKTVLDEYTKQFQGDFDELIASGEFIY